jgi:ketosteroid isomerase-like protein
MPARQTHAKQPEDLARLFVERVQAQDAEGLAALYEPDAVVAYPPGRQTVGHEAILALYQQMVENPPPVKVEEPLPTIYFGDLALTSTRSSDNTGTRVQVARRQTDGSWLRIIDRPEVRG